MNIRTLLLILLAALLAAFSLANWEAFTTPTTLSLVFASVRAPLGLIMLGFTGLLAASFLVYIVYQQAGAILDSRRAARELAAAMELAGKAEASRFTELRAWIDGEFRKLEARIEKVAAEMGSRVDFASKAQSDRLTENVNGLSAHIGEVEDKLDRALAR
jgi:uncharacterized integral membrane protein